MTSEQDRPAGAAPLPVLTVAAVARRLGVAPSTLRTWDRRYGLGPSAHTAGSHRRYGPDDLHRLSVMRGLTLEGVPPAEAAQIALGGPARDHVRLDTLPGDLLFGDDLRDDFAADGAPDGCAAHDDAATARADGERTGHALPEAAPTVSGPLEPLEGLDDPSGGRLDLEEIARASAAFEERYGGRLFGLGGQGAGPVHPPGRSAEAGRGSAVWITQESLPGAPRSVPPAELHGSTALLGAEALLGPAGGVGTSGRGASADAKAGPAGGRRAGGGRVLSLPDGSPRARGLARAAMALDSFELHRLLRDAIGAYGVIGTWDSMVMPVLIGLGERWRASGEGVDVEHAFSEAVLCALRGVTVTLYRPRNAVPVLLACPDGEHHSLPLHAMAAALAEEEVGCRMLGAGLPSPALVGAVRRTGPAVVFLYARLPVTGAAVLRELPRQRPVPQVLLGGPGWDGVSLPAATTQVATLTEAVTAVLAAARLRPTTDH